MEISHDQASRNKQLEQLHNNEEKREDDGHKEETTRKENESDKSNTL